MFATILIVEDESGIRELIKDALVDSGFDVTMARNAQAAQASVNEQRPDLAIVDWMMPQISGIELVRQLRKNSVTQALPIIMLTARSTEDDTIRGLEAGADDYITKPFSQRLLGERIKAVLRRAKLTNIELPEPQEGDDKVIRRGKLLLDPNRHACSWDGNAVRLTVTEFLILESLAKRPGYVKSRDQLMDAAYDDQIYVDDRTIDSHIKRLRKKFRKTDKTFDGIETLYGVGYKYKEA